MITANTHTDEALDYWGNQYRVSKLMRQMTFEAFMALDEARRRQVLKFGEASRAAMAMPGKLVVRCSMAAMR